MERTTSTNSLKDGSHHAGSSGSGGDIRVGAEVGGGLQLNPTSTSELSLGSTSTSRRFTGLVIPPFKNFPTHQSQAQPQVQPQPFASTSTLQPLKTPTSTPTTNDFIPSLKPLFWSPHFAKEGTEIDIYLEAEALRGSQNYKGSPTSTSTTPLPVASTSNSTLDSPPLVPAVPLLIRRFVVIIGNSVNSTKYTRVKHIPEINLTSLREQDDFVRITTRVPNLTAILGREGAPSSRERVYVFVRVVDECMRLIEEVYIGDWDLSSLVLNTSIGHGSIRPAPSIETSAQLKRAGDELESGRTGTPIATSSVLPSTISSDANLTPIKLPEKSTKSTKSTRTPKGSSTPSTSIISSQLPPLEDNNLSQSEQPDLIRASQIIPQGEQSNTITYSSPVELRIQGDLNSMALGWSSSEWMNRRRLIQIFRRQIGNVVEMSFTPIRQTNWKAVDLKHMIVISCIYRDEDNECFVTSVDAIYLLEALVGIKFTVEEKNRIRRNLEGFKPLTVFKGKDHCESFFKLIMSFPTPKPRNIEKDVKVFPFKIIEGALIKIMAKYSATTTVDSSLPPPLSATFAITTNPSKPPLLLPLSLPHPHRLSSVASTSSSSSSSQHAPASPSNPPKLAGSGKGLAIVSKITPPPHFLYVPTSTSSTKNMAVGTAVAAVVEGGLDLRTVDEQKDVDVDVGEDVDVDAEGEIEVDTEIENENGNGVVANGEIKEGVIVI